MPHSASAYRLTLSHPDQPAPGGQCRRGEHAGQGPEAKQSINREPQANQRTRAATGADVSAGAEEDIGPNVGRILVAAEEETGAEGLDPRDLQLGAAVRLGHQQYGNQ